MIKTPIDFWRSGMAFWFRTAEAQMNLTLSMMSGMSKWNVMALSPHDIKEHSVTGKPAPKPRATPSLQVMPAGKDAGVKSEEKSGQGEAEAVVEAPLQNQWLRSEAS